MKFLARLVFWPGNREKWSQSKNFFGLCLFMLNDIRKTIVQTILMKSPEKVVCTPTPNICLRKRLFSIMKRGL